MDEYFQWRYMMEYYSMIIGSAILLIGGLIGLVGHIYDKMIRKFLYRRPQKAYSTSKDYFQYSPLLGIETYAWYREWDQKRLIWVPICLWENAPWYKRLIARK
jgi:hypothetical protein